MGAKQAHGLQVYVNKKTDAVYLQHLGPSSNVPGGLTTLGGPIPIGTEDVAERGLIVLQQNLLGPPNTLLAPVSINEERWMERQCLVMGVYNTNGAIELWPIKKASRGKVGEPDDVVRISKDARPDEFLQAFNLALSRCS